MPHANGKRIFSSLRAPGICWGLFYLFLNWSSVNNNEVEKVGVRFEIVERLSVRDVSVRD